MEAWSEPSPAIKQTAPGICRTTAAIASTNVEMSFSGSRRAEQTSSN